METCPYCQQVFTSITSRHKAICEGWPKASPPEPCLCGHVSTSRTQQKRHQSACDTWKARDKKAVYNDRKKATSLARYGVEDGAQAPEVVARRRATTLARYGAENPFSKEASTFQKVQDSLEGKRPVLKGADNPFSREEVKEKLRETMVEKYGAANPQQVPEIRARSRATNLERYGGELLGSPTLRAKADKTNLARYGTTEPSRTPEVIERIRQTNLARYGVNWTNQDPDTRRLQLETMHANYGSHYFASEEGKRDVRAALMERYGVEFPAQIEGNWEKTVAVFREKYGVDHPLQSEVFLEALRNTCRERYGNDYFLWSESHRSENIAKYGVDHPMKNREYARKHLERMGPNMGPTLPERLTASYAPTLLYTGNRTYWRWLPKLSKHKNPDFILPGPYPEKPKKDVTRVVEVFGNFWHSRIFTGKAPFDHEQDLIEAYADIGIDCLILWESEIKSNPNEVRDRLARFLDR